MDKKFLLIFLLLILSNTIFANTFKFASLSHGVRQNGMGDAFTGVSDDITALYSNPSGILNINNFEFNIAHQSLFYDLSIENISYGKKFGNTGFAINGMFLHTFIGNQGDDVRISSAQSSGRLNFYNLLLSGTYAFMLNKNLSFGLTAKYMQFSVSDFKTSSIGVDLGALYKIKLFKRKLKEVKKETIEKEWDDLKIGLCVQNIGSGISSKNTESESAPLNIKLGIGFQPIKYFLIASDIGVQDMLSEYRYLTAGFGTEIYPLNSISVRAGYSIPDINRSEGFITAGLGINLSLYALLYKIDYAYNLRDESLGTVHRFSLSIGRFPGLIKWMPMRKLLYPDELKRFKDIIILKKAKKIEKKREKKQYSIRVEDLTTKDEYLSSHLFHKTISDELRTLIREDKILNYKEKSPDLILKGSIKQAGELLSIKIVLIDNETKKITADTIFTFPVKFSREQAGYETVVMVKKRADGSYGIVPVVDTKRKDEIKKLKEFSVKINNWVTENYLDALSGTIKVVSKEKNVRLFVNGRFHDIDNRELKLEKGKYSLEFIKEGRPSVKHEIVVKPGSTIPIQLDFKRAVFYSDLRIESYPSGLEFYIDGKKIGKTPYTVKRVKNGTHSVALIYKKDRFESKINIDTEGIYKIYGIFEYENSLTGTKSKILKEIVSDKKLSTEWSSKGFVIKGIPDNGIWEGTGFTTPLFFPGNLETEIRYTSSDKDIYALFGIVDENDNGFVVGDDGNLYQYSVWGELSRPLFIKAREVVEKKAERKVKILYNSDTKELIASIDDKEVERREADLKGRIRIVMLADSLSPNKKVEVITRNLIIHNR